MNYFYFFVITFLLKLVKELKPNIAKPKVDLRFYKPLFLICAYLMRTDYPKEVFEKDMNFIHKIGPKLIEVL